MGFRLDLSCLSSLLQVAFDRSPGHAKELDDVGTLIALIDRTKDTFSQIWRIRFHRLSPFSACLLLPFLPSFYHWLKIFADRCRLLTLGCAPAASPLRYRMYWGR